MRAPVAFVLVAALWWPAACSVKKVRFTAAVDGGRGDAGAPDARPIADAAPRDANAPDAPAPDANPRDGASPDAMMRDASAQDANPRDATARDAEAVDARPRDAEAVDASLRDAEGVDATLHDAGPPDAALADSGTGGHPATDAGGSDAPDAAPSDGPPTCGTNLVPAMTGPTTPSGAVFSSGLLSSDYDAWQAFDASTTSMWISPQGQDPTSIGYAWDDGPRTVLAYAITYANGSILTRAPSAWTLQGLQGDAWISVDAREGELGWKGFERRVYTVASPGPYSEYRLTITDDNDSTAGIVVISIGNLELLGCPP